MGRKVLVSLTNCGEVAREGVEVTLSAQRPTASGNSIVGVYDFTETTDESGECEFEDVVTGIRLDVKFDGKWVRSVVVPDEVGDVQLASLWGTSGQETDTVSQAIETSITQHNQANDAHAGKFVTSIFGRANAVTAQDGDYPFNGRNVTGGSDTLQPTDDQRFIRFDRPTDIELILPNNLPAGFTCELRQAGMGKVVCTLASGADLRAFGDATQTAGESAIASITVDTNSNGTSAVYWLSGTIE